mmetsp:Transcript_62208/g.190003  ORF Transcript_62208/g.190003 Transcript_62208/m.190003 type:complete len:351 (-) Transcript_62208:208-1260(-)
MVHGRRLQVHVVDLRGQGAELLLEASDLRLFADHVAHLLRDVGGRAQLVISQSAVKVDACAVQHVLQGVDLQVHQGDVQRHTVQHPLRFDVHGQYNVHDLWGLRQLRGHYGVVRTVKDVHRRHAIDGGELREQGALCRHGILDQAVALVDDKRASARVVRHDREVQLRVGLGIPRQRCQATATEVPHGVEHRAFKSRVVIELWLVLKDVDRMDVMPNARLYVHKPHGHELIQEPAGHVVSRLRHRGPEIELAVDLPRLRRAGVPVERHQRRLVDSAPARASPVVRLGAVAERDARLGRVVRQRGELGKGRCRGRVEPHVEATEPDVFVEVPAFQRAVLDVDLGPIIVDAS